jgi:NAD(P)-dependent dehydrogenase (short-subunit alcohol dehydrogenase family)
MHAVRCPPLVANAGEGYAAVSVQGERAMTKSATYPDLEGRSVLVSGGGSGIGAQIVRRFCEQGCMVAFLDVDRKASEELLAALGREGLTQPLFLPCDLRDIDALRRCVAQSEEANGPITVLVNNAARDDRHPFDTVTPEYWDERFAVNLKHQFFAAQAQSSTWVRPRGWRGRVAWPPTPRLSRPCSA